MPNMNNYISKEHFLDSNFDQETGFVQLSSLITVKVIDLYPTLLFENTVRVPLQRLKIRNTHLMCIRGTRFITLKSFPSWNSERLDWERGLPSFWWAKIHACRNKVFAWCQRHLNVSGGHKRSHNLENRGASKWKGMWMWLWYCMWIWLCYSIGCVFF